MGSYSLPPPVVEISLSSLSSKLSSAYLFADFLATERLGRSVAGDDVAAGIDELPPGLVSPVGSDAGGAGACDAVGSDVNCKLRVHFDVDDFARFLRNGEIFATVTSIPSSSSYDVD